MKYTILIVLTFCCWSAAQTATPAQQEKRGVLPTGNAELPKGLFPASNEVLVGSVVRYDASLNSHTPAADMAVKLKEEGNKYVRLLYSPHDFGFDAPPATELQRLPKEMFSNGSLVWTFRVHVPRNPAEKSACTSVRKQLAPGKHGKVVEIERYTSVPGRENDQTPKPESLQCMIVETWANDFRLLRISPH
jgi:hypothetical protein